MNLEKIGGFFLVFAGFVLAIFMSAWTTEQRVTHRLSGQFNIQSAESIARSNLSELCGDFQGVGATECLDTVIASARSIERAEEDLQAQQEMADWAFGMHLTALASALVSLLGLGLVYLTAKYARQAALAAFKMNDLTDALERPILGIQVTGAPPQFVDDLIKKEPLRFAIQNMGRSPALVTEIHRAWLICERRELPPPPQSGRSAKMGITKRWQRHVAGGSSTEGIWPAEGSVFDGLSALQLAEKRIYFFGWLQFQDMNEKPYVAGFTYFYDEGNNSFAMAWPNEDPELFNYCKPAGSTPEC